MTNVRIDTSQIFSGLADRYLPSTIEELNYSNRNKTGGFFATDKKVLEIVFSSNINRAKAIDALVKWMGSYGVIQGLRHLKGNNGALFVDDVASATIDLYEKWGDRDTALGKKDLLNRFEELNKSIGKRFNMDRSFLSMTSKLLWLQYRTVTPIYDQNARVAVEILYKLKKSFLNNEYYDNKNHNHKRPRQKPKEGSHQKDCEKYGHFYEVYYNVFNEIRPYIEEKLIENECKIEPIRYFDRILWILGSNSEDIGLIKSN